MIQEKNNATGQEKDSQPLTIRDMYNANWHFGELQAYTHPSMLGYIARREHRYELINLPEAKALMEDALKFLTKLTSAGGKILIVGRDQKMLGFVEQTAKEAGQFYVAGKWPGGLLTNWHKTFYPSMQSLKAKENYLTSPKAARELTKREHNKQIKKLEKGKNAFAGVLEMSEQLPAAVIVVSGKDMKPIKEAVQCGIPVIVLCDTSTDARLIQYPVPGNTASISTVEMFLDLILDACRQGAAQYRQPEERVSQKFFSPRTTEKAPPKPNTEQA